MKIAGVIFDLDGTIVDSAMLDALRQSREWKRCVAALAATALFDGVTTLVDDLNALGIPHAIVTSSVSYYASALLSHHGITSPLIAYHDTSRHKPHPEPILSALARLGLSSGDGVIGIGDAAGDCEAYKAANVMAVGAGWSPALDAAAPWHAIATSPAWITSRLTAT